MEEILKGKRILIVDDEPDISRDSGRNTGPVFY